MEVKIGDDKGNRTKFDTTIIKVNYNRCDARKGGTFVHRVLNNILNNGNSTCPIKKGYLSIAGSFSESNFPPVPRFLFPNGKVRFLLKLLINARPAGENSMTNLISMDISGFYEK